MWLFLLAAPCFGTEVLTGDLANALHDLENKADRIEEQKHEICSILQAGHHSRTVIQHVTWV